MINYANIEKNNEEAFAEWMSRQIIPKGKTNAGKPYKSVETYIGAIKSVKVHLDGNDYSAFALTNPDDVLNLEAANPQQSKNQSGKQKKSSALSHYINFLEKYIILTDNYEKYIKQLDDITLKKEAAKNRGVIPQKAEITIFEYNRNVAVREFAKRKANGQCQLCGNDAPFLDSDGEPFLEVHHIKWLKDNGEDSIDNVIALCPNCHRKMHIINDIDDVKFLSDIAIDFANE